MLCGLHICSDGSQSVLLQRTHGAASIVSLEFACYSKYGFLGNKLERTASTGHCRCDSRGMMLVKACGGRLSGEYTGLLEEADNLGDAGTKNE